MTSDPDVLIVGAGPTALALANQARVHDAHVRIVERRQDADRPSRALLMHPRTLEVLRPLGVTDELMACAHAATSAQLHLGRRTVPVALSELALRDTAFPVLTLLPQRHVERVLAREVGKRGVCVERGTELVDLAIVENRVRVVLRSASGVEALTVPTVAGCDGAQSTVRRLAGIGWVGGGYRQEVILADVDLAGTLVPGVAHVAPARRGVVFAFPRGEAACWRLVATRPAVRDHLPPGRDGPSLPATELQQLLDAAKLDATITRTAWSTRIRVQHRVASQYRRGPVFLAGDAAHAFSPAGGQGMNTGIQDAVNLGWKLAFARRSSEPDGLLDTYQEERRPIGQQTLALTHLLFWAESSTDPVASLLRGTLTPLAGPLVPTLLRNRRLIQATLRLLSGLNVDYRVRRLSVDSRPPSANRLRAGDRLPNWQVACDGRKESLHNLLTGPGFHLLLDRQTPAGPLTADADRPWLRIHRLTRSPRFGVIAVRPDGYIGFRGWTADDPSLRHWLTVTGATAPGTA